LHTFKILFTLLMPEARGTRWPPAKRLGSRVSPAQGSTLSST